MAWIAVAYLTGLNRKFSDLIPVEADKRLKDTEKIKADIEAKLMKREVEGPFDPFMASYLQGQAYFSDTSKTVSLKRPAELFPELNTHSQVLLFDPGLFMRLGLLETICSGAEVPAASAAVYEVRFGMSDGRCVDPGRLLFGREATLLELAQRLGMEGKPGFKEGAELQVRLETQLEVLVRIGRGIWG